MLLRVLFPIESKKALCAQSGHVSLFPAEVICLTINVIQTQSPAAKNTSNACLCRVNMRSQFERRYSHLSFLAGLEKYPYLGLVDRIAINTPATARSFDSPVFIVLNTTPVTPAAITHHLIKLRYHSIFHIAIFPLFHQFHPQEFFSETNLSRRWNNGNCFLRY